MSALFPIRAITELYKRAHTQRRRAATIVVACLVLGLAYHVIFGQNGLTEDLRKHMDQRHLSAQIQSLQQENERLRDHVDRLQNDPSAIEHQARVDLHYTRPGEVIYTLPAPPAKDTSKH